MEKENKKVSRKKFLVWGIGFSIAAPTFIKFFLPKKKESTTAKMLTRDGRLVEVDRANIPAKRKKLSTSDIRRWVQKTSL